MRPAMAGRRYHITSPRQRHELLSTTIVVACVCYNAVLAIICARSNVINMSVVIACEIAILGAGLYIIIDRGFASYDLLPLGFSTFALITSVAISFNTSIVFVDALRNCLIISTFYALGRSTSFEVIYKSVAICSILVLIILILELVSLSTYVTIFQPARYISATRGVAQSQFNELGVFANALGYEGRFSFGLSTGPRTSSLFLEQVSLSSFCVVLSIFTFSSWNRTSFKFNVLSITLMVLIALTNNSRAASTLSIVISIGYLLFPKMRVSYTYLVAPTLLIFAFAFTFSGDMSAPIEDNFSGRIAITVRDLCGTPLLSFLIGDVAKAKASFDSGYMYIIASMTIWGMLSLYIFTNNACPGRGPDQRRCSWSVNTYIWSWLMIGGTAIFSIKTSALLWLIVGHVASRKPRQELALIKTRRSFRSYWDASKT